MEHAIQNLLDIRAIEPVPPGQWRRGFYSILFAVPKRSGGWRAILDLKVLNKHLIYRRLKMYSLLFILQGIRPGDFMASIDLLEAYLHIRISPNNQRSLRFCYTGRHLQYCAMPFGLASAPLCFMKVLAALATHLRLSRVRLQAYLDNILILASSPQKAETDLNLTIQKPMGFY